MSTYTDNLYLGYASLVNNANRNLINNSYNSWVDQYTNSLNNLDNSSSVDYSSYYSTSGTVKKTTIHDGTYAIDNSISDTVLTGTSNGQRIFNSGNLVLINTGDGNNDVDNEGAFVFINCGAGDDTVGSDNEYSKAAGFVVITGGDGNDRIGNVGDFGFIFGGNGDDYLINAKSNGSTGIILSGGDGNDEIHNGLFKIDGYSVTNLDGSDGVFMYGGNGNDLISSRFGKNITISGGDGDDTIDASFSTSSNTDSISNIIYGGAGNDSIHAGYGNKHTTIYGGTGDDDIDVFNSNQYFVIQYAEGDGNDTIKNSSSNDTLQIYSSSGYYTVESGEYDAIINIGENSIFVEGGNPNNPINPGGLMPTIVEISESELVTSNTNLTEDPVEFTGDTLNSLYESLHSAMNATDNSTDSTPAAVDNSTNTVSYDMVDTGNSPVNGVSVDGENVVLVLSDGNRVVENAKGKTVHFNSSFIVDGPIAVQFTGNEVKLNDEAKFYWAAEEDATVSLESLTAASALVDLSYVNYNDKSRLSFFGGVKNINATNYYGFSDLRGNESNNSITGGNGSSTLYGGNGGDDTLIGGSGSDVFLYTRNNGNDVVKNAAENDVVRMADLTVFNDFVAFGDDLFVGNDVQINFKDGGSLKVENAKTNGVVFEIEGVGFTVNKDSGQWEVCDIGTVNTLIGSDEADVFVYGENSGNVVVQNASENDMVYLDNIYIGDLVAFGDDLFVGNDVRIDLKDGGSLLVENAKTNGVVFEIEGVGFAVNKDSGQWEVR